MKEISPNWRDALPENAETFTAWTPMLQKSISFEEPSANDANPQWGIITGVVSTETVDADGDVILQKGLDWSFFLKKGIINYNHKDERLGEPLKVHCVGDVTFLKAALYLTVPRAAKIFETSTQMALAKANRSYGFSIEGQVISRDPNNPHIVTKAIVYATSVCEYPKNGDSSWKPLLKKAMSFFSDAPSDPASPADALVDVFLERAGLSRLIRKSFPETPEAVASTLLAMAGSAPKDTPMDIVTRETVTDELRKALGDEPTAEMVEKALASRAKPAVASTNAISAVIGELRKAFEAEQTSTIETVQKSLKDIEAATATAVDSHVAGLTKGIEARMGVLAKGLDVSLSAQAEQAAQLGRIEKALEAMGNTIEPPTAVLSPEAAAAPSPLEPSKTLAKSFSYEEISDFATAKVEALARSGGNLEPLTKAVADLDAQVDPNIIARDLANAGFNVRA